MTTWTNSRGEAVEVAVKIVCNLNRNGYEIPGTEHVAVIATRNGIREMETCMVGTDMAVAPYRVGRVGIPACKVADIKAEIATAESDARVVEYARKCAESDALQTKRAAFVRMMESE